MNNDIHWNIDPDVSFRIFIEFFGKVCTSFDLFEWS